MPNGLQPPDGYNWDRREPVSDCIELAKLPSPPIITAYYVGVETVGKDKRKQYIFDTPEGERFRVWSFAMLDMCMNNCEQGVLTCLVYGGKKKTPDGRGGFNEAHQVEVFQDGEHRRNLAL